MSYEKLLNSWAYRVLEEAQVNIFRFNLFQKDFNCNKSIILEPFVSNYQNKDQYSCKATV